MNSIAVNFNIYYPTMETVLWVYLVSYILMEMYSLFEIFYSNKSVKLKYEQNVFVYSKHSVKEPRFQTYKPFIFRMFQKIKVFEVKKILFWIAVIVLLPLTFLFSITYGLRDLIQTRKRIPLL